MAIDDDDDASNRGDISPSRWLAVESRGRRNIYGSLTPDTKLHNCQTVAKLTVASHGESWSILEQLPVRIWRRGTARSKPASRAKFEIRHTTSVLNIFSNPKRRILNFNDIV
ncbi:uncharacterized protein LOC143917313 [Arctopsyche grandis]|uniref:uncharacterized protein LOC143917313 n=1 Tax=Arctopsyche grandis TaxID=121162 RepID=UPI00406D9967